MNAKILMFAFCIEAILYLSLYNLRDSTFKLYNYKSKERRVLHLNNLIKNVTKVKKLERKIASICKKKAVQFNNKWKTTDSKITV